MQIVMKGVTLASNCAKIEANKTHGWKSVEETGKIGDTLHLVARVYVWKFGKNNVTGSGGEKLMTKTQKIELLARDDLQSQIDAP